MYLCADEVFKEGNFVSISAHKHDSWYFHRFNTRDGV